MKALLAWFYCQNGATAIEYGLLASGVAITIVAAIFALGDDLGAIFNMVGDSMDNAVSNASS